MKFFLFGALILACSAVQAEGVYDGIWEADNLGYISIHENSGTIVAIRLDNDTAEWEAYLGPLFGNTSKIVTLIGSAEVVLNITFTSKSIASVTQISCIPREEGSICLLSDGSTFQARKIW